MRRGMVIASLRQANRQKILYVSEVQIESTVRVASLVAKKGV